MVGRTGVRWGEEDETKEEERRLEFISFPFSLRDLRADSVSVLPFSTDVNPWVLFSLEDRFHYINKAAQMVPIRENHKELVKRDQAGVFDAFILEKPWVQVITLNDSIRGAHLLCRTGESPDPSPSPFPTRFR